jgi:hypothetical protein
MHFLRVLLMLLCCSPAMALAQSVEEEQQAIALATSWLQALDKDNAASDWQKVAAQLPNPKMQQMYVESQQRWRRELGALQSRTLSGIKQQNQLPLGYEVLFTSKFAAQEKTETEMVSIIKHHTGEFRVISYFSITHR